MSEQTYGETFAVAPSGLVNRRDAAAFLGRQPATLRSWVTKQRGPRVIQVEGRAFYRIEDLRRLVSGDQAQSEAA